MRGKTSKPKKKPAKKKPMFKTWIISMLRKACLRWPPYYETKKAATLEAFVHSAVKVKEGMYAVAYRTEDGEQATLMAHHLPKLGKRKLIKCELCGGIFLDKDYYTYKNGKKKKRTTTVVDHIKPVVDPKCGFISWDEYITRMFPQEPGKHFQCICHACHTEKGKEELNERLSQGDKAKSPSTCTKKSKRGL